MKKIIYLFVGAVALFLPLAALAHTGDDEYYHHASEFGMMGFGGDYGMMGYVGWISMVLVWVFLILGIIAFWVYIQKNQKK